MPHDEHAALALMSIDDPAERAYWGLRLFGKRYPDTLALLLTPIFLPAGREDT